MRLGGSVTGEHGIGVEKLDFLPDMFSAESLAVMVRLRGAFNPGNRCSPHKILPAGGGCVEGNHVVSATKPSRRAAV